MLPQWGDKPIANITRADAKALIREKARTAPIAANRLLSLISKIFAWALDEEIIQASPAVRLKRPGVEQERERSLTDEEICKLWPAFTAIGYPFGHGLKFLLVTGQHRGEVAGMKWSEIDGDGWKSPALAQSQSRGIVSRSPLSHLKSLRRRPVLASLSLFRLGGPTRLTAGKMPSGAWIAFLREPIEPWRIHDLRRTMATQVRSLGLIASLCRSS